jgi:hypothetical protein
MIIASNKPLEKGTGAQGVCAHSYMNREDLALAPRRTPLNVVASVAVAN